LADQRPVHPCSALKEGLGLLKLNLNNLIIFFQFYFLAKTLVMLSRDHQTDSSLRNVGESVPPLSICFGAVRDRTVKFTLLMEGERKSCLTDGIACVGLFDHNVNGEFRNWLLLRGFRHPAKKKDCSTDEKPSSKSQVIAAKHEIVTPFRISALQHDNSGSERFKGVEDLLVDLQQTLDELE
jgi:hypothetical protein